MIKILTDENIHIKIIEKLKNNKFDVVSVIDKNLIGKPDIIILDTANKEERILITSDKDFGGILEFGHLYGKGRILLLRYRILHFEKIAEDVILVLNKLKDEYNQNKGLLVVLSETKYRVHKPLYK